MWQSIKKRGYKQDLLHFYHKNITFADKNQSTMKFKILYIPLFVVLSLLYGCTIKDPWSDLQNVYPCSPEIPEKIENSDFIYVTHEALLNNRTVRNYTLCFDKTKYAARWVAYPLHKSYRGNSGRTYDTRDVWPYDPEISSSLQAVGKGGYSGYTRGHQIPSADRTATVDLNKQTFYMSNMTPQAYDFNGGIWLNLEDKVRSNMGKNDTIYVVTGAHWENTNIKAGKYPVPTHYYKVVLKSHSGTSVYSAPKSDLRCIGFWMSHRATGTLNSSYCKSVKEIEQLTGFTFFPKVDVDKTQCVPSQWGF
jgi:endonuclease G